MKKFGSGKGKSITGSLAKSRKLIIGGIIALIFALVIWGIMLFVENLLINGQTKKNVLVTNKSVLAGARLEKEGTKNAIVEETVIPASAITSVDEVKDMTALFEIPAGTILTKEMFSEKKSLSGNNRVIGLTTDMLYRSVNGVLRSGDLVNIYFINQDKKSSADSSVVEERPDTGEISTNSIASLKEIYVDNVFDANGNPLQGSTESSNIAASYNLLTTEEQAEQIISWIEQGKGIIVTKRED